MKMRATISFIVLIMMYHSMPIIRAQVCTRKNENQMDTNLARLMVFGRKDVKFPQNERELRPFCNEVARMLDRVTEYAKQCLNGFGRNAYNVLSHAMFSEMRSICKPGRINKRAKLLLEAAICGNLGNELIYKHCYSKMVDRITASLSMDVKKRIPITCCNFFEFIRCWEIQAEKFKQCTPMARDFFVKWVSKMFEGITQIMCVQYDESSDACDDIIRDSPQLNSTQRGYKSVFLPLLKIAMSLDTDALN